MRKFTDLFSKFKIVKRPPEHTLQSVAILLVIPLFFLNVWILNKGPVRSLFEEGNIPYIIAVSLWILLTLSWLLKARWKGFWSLWVLATVLLWGNLYFLVQTKNYALAFYALFLLTLSIPYFIRLYRNLRESYYNPGWKWYEGRPKLLPRIEVELLSRQNQDYTVKARLSRLDTAGCYVFPNSPSSTEKTLDLLKSADFIRLSLGKQTLSCPVSLVTVTPDEQGGGFRFLTENQDQTKDVWDFIDRARSLGYVN